ncbi:hypothetical protein [Streptomyces sp. NPDC005573]|uniref:hypothetical protein n=1 Tax=Streptomyces sp. NPDC005573 TaxID=3156890 RepID=UPI0033BACCC6
MTCTDTSRTLPQPPSRVVTDVGERALLRGWLAGWLSRGRGGRGAAEKAECRLGAVVAAGGGYFVEVPGHLADDGAARAEGSDGAVQFTDLRGVRIVCDLRQGVEWASGTAWP